MRAAARGLLVALALLAASAAEAQDHAVAGGLSSTAGIAGVEYVRHVRGQPLGFALGAGAAGLGARAQYRRDEFVDADDVVQTRVVSAGAVVSPWRLGQDGGPILMLSAEYGREYVFPFGLYAHAALGVIVPVGGSLNGSGLLPSLRFVVGGAF